MTKLSVAPQMRHSCCVCFSGMSLGLGCTCTGTVVRQQPERRIHATLCRHHSEYSGQQNHVSQNRDKGLYYTKMGYFKYCTRSWPGYSSPYKCSHWPQLWLYVISDLWSACPASTTMKLYLYVHWPGVITVQILHTLNKDFSVDQELSPLYCQM